MKRPNRKDYINKEPKNKLIADLELYIDYMEKKFNDAQQQLKILNIPVVVQQSELVCMCKGTIQVNRINDKYICCTCNRPLM